MVAVLHRRAFGEVLDVLGGAPVAQPQGVAELVEDGVAHLLLVRAPAGVCDVEGVIAHQRQARGVGVCTHPVTEYAGAEDVRALAELVDGVDELECLVLARIEVHVAVVDRLAAEALVVVGDVGVVLAGVDVQGNAVGLKQVHEIIQALRRRGVGGAVGVCALAGSVAVAAEGVVFGGHPVQLEEDIRTLRVRTPVRQRDFRAVG